jgi:hypothetical protein
MPKIDKVQFCKDSGFDRDRAMELANLIEVAYDEYGVWDWNQTNLHISSLPPQDILSSTEYVDLPAFLDLPGKNLPRDYGWLDQFWQKTNKVKQYDRLDNFWATEWWWLNLLNVPFLAESLTHNLGGIFNRLRNIESLRDIITTAGHLGKDLLDNLQDLVVDDQLFGFVARSQTNPNEIFVVFRGTREPAEWFNNFKPIPQIFLEEDDKFGKLGEVRNGFNKIYTERNHGQQPTIKETIVKLFETQQDLLNNDSQIFITGHSLGAGLATLAALHISEIAKSKNLQPSIHLYTFASPRVGDATFAEKFDTLPFDMEQIK